MPVNAMRRGPIRSIRPPIIGTQDRRRTEQQIAGGNLRAAPAELLLQRGDEQAQRIDVRGAEGLSDGRRDHGGPCRLPFVPGRSGRTHRRAYRKSTMLCVGRVSESPSGRSVALRTPLYSIAISSVRSYSSTKGPYSARRANRFADYDGRWSLSWITVAAAPLAADHIRRAHIAGDPRHPLFAFAVGADKQGPSDMGGQPGCELRRCVERDRLDRVKVVERSVTVEMRGHRDDTIEAAAQQARETARRDRLARLAALVLPHIGKIRRNQGDQTGAEVARGVRREQQAEDLLMEMGERTHTPAQHACGRSAL